MLIQYDMTLQYYLNMPKIRMQCVSTIQENIFHLLVVSRIRLSFFIDIKMLLIFGIWVSRAKVL